MNGTYEWNKSAARAPRLADGSAALFVGFHDQILAPIEIRKHECPTRACRAEAGVSSDVRCHADLSWAYRWATLHSESLENDSAVAYMPMQQLWNGAKGRGEVVTQQQVLDMLREQQDAMWIDERTCVVVIRLWCAPFLLPPTFPLPSKP